MSLIRWVVAALVGFTMLGVAAPAHAEDPGVYDITLDRSIYPASGSMTVSWRTVAPPSGTLLSKATCTIAYGGSDRWSGACRSGQAFTYDVGAVGRADDATVTIQVGYTTPFNPTTTYYLTGTSASFWFDGVAPTAGVAYFMNLWDVGEAPQPMKPNTSYRVSLWARDNVDVRGQKCWIERVDPGPAGWLRDVNCPPGAPGGPPGFLTPATSGTYKFAVEAYDYADNVSTVAWRNFVVDADGPVVTFDSGPTDGSATNKATVSWSWHADEPGTYRCSVQPSGVAASYTACTSPYSSGALAEGDYDLAVEGTDALGNVSTTTVGFTVDRTKPVMTITSGPADGATVSSPSVSYSFYSTSVVAYECWWGTPAETPTYSSCTSGQAVTLPGDGTYVFAFRARDAADNLSDEVLRTVTVAVPPPDTTPPTLTVVKRPKAKVQLLKGHTKVTCTVKVSLSETSTVHYRVDGGAWRVGSKTLKVKVAKGKHTVQVYAVDAADNASATTKVAWKVVKAS